MRFKTINPATPGLTALCRGLILKSFCCILAKMDKLSLQTFPGTALRKRTVWRRDVNYIEHVHRFRHVTAQGDLQWI